MRGDTFGMPHVRPMPSIGARCPELRTPDGSANLCIMVRVDEDAVESLEVFSKKSQTTPKKSKKEKLEAAEWEVGSSQSRVAKMAWRVRRVQRFVALQSRSYVPSLVDLTSFHLKHPTTWSLTIPTDCMNA